MNQRAQNQFANLLAHVPQSPPREAREIEALALWPILRPYLFLSLIFCSLMFLFPLILLTVDKDFQAQRRVLKTVSGVVLTAEKLPIPPQNSTEFPGSTNLKFSFRTSGGTTFYGQQNVSNDSPFALLQKGAALPIKFDSKEPSFNGVAGVLGSNPFPVGALFLMPLIGFLYAGMFSGALLKPLRQRMLARSVYQKGELTIGHVDFVGKKNGVFSALTQSKQSTDVLFHFQDAEGKTHRARQTCDNDWLLQKLDVGSELQVAYLREKPERSIFLENFIA